MDDYGGSYASAASAAVGSDVLAAGLFEPNVPDFLGGLAGLITGPMRRSRLRHIGAVTNDCLVAVTQGTIHCLLVRLHLRGFVLEDEMTRWARSEVEVLSVPIATWCLRPPPHRPAIHVVEWSRPVAELKPQGESPGYRAVLVELLGPEYDSVNDRRH